MQNYFLVKAIKLINRFHLGQLQCSFRFRSVLQGLVMLRKDFNQPELLMEWNLN